MVCPVEIRLEALMRGVFVTLRDKVPALTAYQCSKEPTGVGRPDHLGMLGKTEEGQPPAVTITDEPVGVGLLEEDEESCGVYEIFGHNVGESWCVVRGLLGVFPLLHVTTRSGSAGDGFCVLDGKR